MPARLSDDELITQEPVIFVACLSFTDVSIYAICTLPEDLLTPMDVEIYSSVFIQVGQVIAAMVMLDQPDILLAYLRFPLVAS